MLLHDRKLGPQALVLRPVDVFVGLQALDRGSVDPFVRPVDFVLGAQQEDFRGLVDDARLVLGRWQRLRRRLIRTLLLSEHFLCYMYLDGRVN